MTYNNYLPPDEDKLKSGIYKVSFEIKVESQDELSLSDITYDLTEGLVRGFGDNFIGKVAALNIEPLEIKKESPVIGVGDRVRLVGEIEIKADVYSDDGYLFIGNPNEISEKMTHEPADIKLSAGCTGYVNKINKDGSLEVADLDKPYVNQKWEEIGIDAVNVDLITVKAEQVEKLEEGK